MAGRREEQPGREARPKMAFWTHQAIEYLIGILLIAQAVTLADPNLPLLGGAALVLLAATADGPLGAFKVVPRPVHRLADVGVAVALAAVAIVWRDQAGTTGAILLGVAAASLALLVWRTNYRPRRIKGSPRPAQDVPGGDPATGSKGAMYGKAAGRAVGKGINTFRGKD